MKYNWASAKTSELNVKKTVLVCVLKEMRYNDEKEKNESRSVR